MSGFPSIIPSTLSSIYNPSFYGISSQTTVTPNELKGVIPGTIQASKAIVCDSNSRIDRLGIGVNPQSDGISTAGGVNSYGPIAILNSSAAANVPLYVGGYTSKTFYSYGAVGNSGFTTHGFNVTPELSIESTNSISISSGGLYLRSDKRLKENISSIDNSKFLKLEDLKISNYTWKKNPEFGTQIGCIAQDLHNLAPELVCCMVNEKDDLLEDKKQWTVNNTSLMYYSLCYVQEIHKLVKTLQQEVLELKEALRDSPSIKKILERKQL